MRTTTIARAWEIKRIDGFRLGFTDHDAALFFNGLRFRPETGLTGRAVMQAVGLAVDNTEAEGALSDDAITERDLMAGRWDDAELRLWEVDWTDIAARRLVFRGSLGEVTRVSGAFRAELRGLSEALNAPQGRVYHMRCAACLGDAACKVDLTREDLHHDITIAGGEDGRLFRFTAFPSFDAGWFEYGALVILDGAAEGLRGVVKNDLAREGGRREVELWEALPLTPETGARVRLIAGCDKRAQSCRMKFDNYLNFRGFPHLPSEDWLIAPQIGARNG